MSHYGTKCNNYCEKIYEELNKFLQKAKMEFQCFKVTNPYSLNFNIYISDDKAIEFIYYLNHWWPVNSLQNDDKVDEINIIISNHQFLAKYVLLIIEHINLFSISYENFLLYQKVLVLQSKEITIFYPINNNSSYPIFLIIGNNFFVINYEINDQNKQIFLGLYREIFTSYFETKAWITYHANGVLLPNNSVAMVVGYPDAGKSTLSTGLCGKGKSIYMCDDRIMLRKLAILPVPTLINLDKRAIKQLGIQKNLPNYFLSPSSTHLEVPIRLFRKKAQLNNNALLSIILIPKFILNMGSNHKITQVEKAEMYNILIDNCFTSKEAWRDKFMFTRYSKPKMMLRSCDFQTKFIISNLKSIQIEFGPLSDYCLIENQILDLIAK